MAAGPTDTRDGNTYVGMSMDWIEPLYGISTMLLWKRPEGPSLLEYRWPGMWVMAAVNSAGVGLTWTSVLNTMKLPGPRIGVPTYVVLTQMLYQDSLKGAIDEARRAKPAGWFTFVLADDQGRIANVEGSPAELAVEYTRGHIARTYYGTRQFTCTPEGEPVKFHPQCQRMWELLASKKGQLDLATLQGFYGDHKSTICRHYGTLDVVIFNTTKREAHIERGPVEAVYVSGLKRRCRPLGKDGNRHPGRACAGWKRSPCAGEAGSTP